LNILSLFWGFIQNGWLINNVKVKKKPVVINLGDKEASHKAFEDIE
jgi:hypothetical protein